MIGILGSGDKPRRAHEITARRSWRNGQADRDPPGEVLADGLQALSMSGATLAPELNVPTDHIVGILSGQGAIAGDTAPRPAHCFGASARFRLNFPSLYELRIAEEKAGTAIKKLPTLKPLERAHARTRRPPITCRRVADEDWFF